MFILESKCRSSGSGGHQCNVVDMNPHTSCPFPPKGTYIFLQTICRHGFTGIWNGAALEWKPAVAWRIKREEHRQLAASQTKEGEGEEDVGGEGEKEEGRGMPERRVKGRVGQSKAHTSPRLWIDNWLLKETPEFCEPGLSLRTPWLTCLLLAHYIIWFSETSQEMREGKYDYPYLTKEENGGSEKPWSQPHERWLCWCSALLSAKCFKSSGLYYSHFHRQVNWDFAEATNHVQGHTANHQQHQVS